MPPRCHLNTSNTEMAVNTTLEYIVFSPLLPSIPDFLIILASRLRTYYPTLFRQDFLSAGDVASGLNTFKKSITIAAILHPTSRETEPFDCHRSNLWSLNSQFLLSLSSSGNQQLYVSFVCIRLMLGSPICTSQSLAFSLHYKLELPLLLSKSEARIN